MPIKWQSEHFLCYGLWVCWVSDPLYHVVSIFSSFPNKTSASHFGAKGWAASTQHVLCPPLRNLPAAVCMPAHFHAPPIIEWARLFSLHAT